MEFLLILSMAFLPIFFKSLGQILIIVIAILIALRIKGE